MWFECSECGGHVQGPSAPAVCPECGVAGAIVMAADPGDVLDGDSAYDLRAVWLRAGLEQPELVARS
jgi:hypothetical protein